MILFEKKYQTFDTVFHHQMKHLEVRQKDSAARRIFNSLLGVSSGDETLHLMFDILHEIHEVKATKVINKVWILLPGVVIFVFTKFQFLSTFTSSVRSDDVKVLKSRWNFVKTKITNSTFSQEIFPKTHYYQTYHWWIAWSGRIVVINRGILFTTCLVWTASSNKWKAPLVLIIIRILDCRQQFTVDVSSWLGNGRSDWWFVWNSGCY